jgi:nucleotidyltransferase/DNA polymerase involved in DNA repair
MDCFYVSVVIRDNPDLRGKSVVVTPSANINGTSEVATASYEARAFGIKSRMHVCEARKLCPDLVVVPCQYDKYFEVSKKLYKILIDYSTQVNIFFPLIKSLNFFLICNFLQIFPNIFLSDLHFSRLKL